MKKKVKIFLVAIVILLVAISIVLYKHDEIFTNNNYSGSIQTSNDGLLVSDTTPPMFKWDGLFSEGWLSEKDKESIKITVWDEESKIKYASVKYEWSKDYGTEDELIAYFTTNGIEAATVDTSNKKWTFKIPNPEVEGYYCWTKIECVDDKGNEKGNKLLEYKVWGPFMFDNIAPIIHEVQSTQEGTWANEDVILTVNATDEGTGIAEYSFNAGITWQESNQIICTESIMPSIRVKDKAGNISKGADWWVSIDKIKPTVRVTPNSSEVCKETNITIMASDAGESGLSSTNEYKYYLSESDIELVGGEWKDYTSKEEINSLGEGKTGKYYLFVKAIKDNAGNISEDAITIGEESYNRFGPYIFDNIAPTIVVSKTKDEKWANSHAVTITIDEDSELAGETKLEYAWSTSKTEELTIWNEITEKSETVTMSGITGKYYLWIKPVNVKDIAGNELTEISVYGEYCFDNEGPIIEFEPNVNETWKKEHSITVQINELINEVEEGAGINKESIKYIWSQEEPTKEEITQSIDGAVINKDTINELGVTIRKNTETGNDWKLWIYAEDLLGNSTIKSSEEFYLDNTAPKIEIPVEGYNATEIISDGLVTNYIRGNNNILDTSITPSESQLPTVGSRTIEMVFKLGESELENTLLYESGSRNTGSGYGAIYVESKYLYLWAGNIQIKQYIGIYANQEVHLAISVDESIIKLYINGKQTNQVSILSEVDWGTNNIKLSGVVSQIRLYNRALGENEILNNYAVNNPKLEIIIPNNQEWKQEHNVQVNLSDEHSGLALGAQMQYGWSTSSGTSPTNWNDATVQEYEEGAHETSFIATGSGLSGKYYLWVKAKELKDTSLENGNEQTTQVVSQHTFWFENIGEGNIDITFSQDGNTEWAKTHSTIVTVKGEYKPSTLKYQWTRNANQPEESTFVNEFTSGQELEITGETGELYLWILAKDEEGNSTIVHSNVFYLDNEGPKLLVTPSKDETLSNVKIIITDVGSGLKESNVYEYALINNFTGDLQTAWEYYNKSSKLEWKEYTSAESFKIGENLKGEFYLIVKGIEDNVGNVNSWNAVPEYIPISLEGNDEDVRAFGPYNINNNQNLDITMTPNGNTTWDKQQEVVISTDNTHELREQKYLWTRESIVTNEMLNRFVGIGNNVKVISPIDAETGKDWHLWVYTEDIYGNIVLEKSSEFYIDTTVPTVEFTPNGNTTWAKSQTVEITIDDLEGSGINTESIKYLWQKESTINPIREDITESFENIEIVEGKIKATVTKDTDTGDNWKLWIYVQDIAGNSKIIGSEVFAIDNTVPVAGTLTMKSENNDGNNYENNTWTTNNVYISVNNGSDEQSGHKATVYSVNGGAETTEPQTLTKSGTYEIIVTTTDNAGNTSTNSYTVKITKEMALEITSNPTQMEYEAYEDFNSEGMIISIVYDNGEKYQTTDYTIINEKNLTCQVTEIQVQYNNNPEIKAILTGIQVNHAEKIGEEIKPTCTEKGKTAGKYCEVCNITLEGQEEIAELGHDYKQEITEPTCIEEGYTTNTCTRCQDTYQSDKTEALGHKFNNYVSNDDATCTQDGTKTGKCENCDETETVTDEGSKLGHNYETEVVKPTCTEGGYTIYTCIRCQVAHEADETEALGHSFTNYISNNDATCTQDGTKTAKCEKCDETETVTDEGSKLGHNYETEVIEPTCTEEGYTTYTCTQCDENYKANYTNALGHKFTNYISNNDATCTEDGSETAKCERCAETDTRTRAGSKLGHNYEAEVVEPTCTEGGYTTYTCTQCDENYKANYTNALGHKFTNYISNNDATCTEDGTKTARCENCDETKTVVDEGSKKTHKYEDGECIYCGEEEPKIRITSEIYTVSDIYISKLQPQTTVEVFKSNIETNATEINIYNKDGELLEEDDIIATGMQLELKLGEMTRGFEIVVKGDLYSDGKADILDMIIINYARLKKETLTGAKLIAADIMEDGKITIDDLVKINKFRLRKISEI